MTPDNFDQILQAFRDRSPFRPFTVVLHSGRQFEVDHPGALVQRDGVAIFVGPGGYRWYSITREWSTSPATWPSGRPPERPGISVRKRYGPGKARHAEPLCGLRSQERGP